MAKRKKDDDGLLSSRTLLAAGLGLVAGYWIARNQRQIVKATVKGGMAAGRTIREVAEEVTEDIEDSVAEVIAEDNSPGEDQ